MLWFAVRTDLSFNCGNTIEMLGAALLIFWLGERRSPGPIYISPPSVLIIPYIVVVVLRITAFAVGPPNVAHIFEYARQPPRRFVDGM